MAWLEELATASPNGVGVTPANVTRGTLARLVADQLYLVTVQHEILGSFMWNYQLWTHRQPARIYRVSTSVHASRWTSTSGWSTPTTT